MLYSIQFTSFEAAEFITSTLNNYQCETLQHLDKQVGPEQYKKPIKAILSAKFEKEIGGLKNVIELVKGPYEPQQEKYSQDACNMRKRKKPELLHRCCTVDFCGFIDVGRD